jgi:hypothetical protein
MKALRAWILGYCFGCFLLCCSPSKEEQQRQDILRTAWERAEQRKVEQHDSLARLNPEKYFTVKLDSIVRFRRSREGDEIHFSIDNQTPFTVDSLRIAFYVTGLFGRDSVMLVPLLIPPKKKEPRKVMTFFKNVDSLVILHKHFR